MLEELERGNALSEKVMVLGTENAADACVNAIAEADSSTGLFLWDFYKNTAQEVAVTRGMDLDMLLTELGEQGGSTVLPLSLIHILGRCPSCPQDLSPELWITLWKSG